VAGDVAEAVDVVESGDGVEDLNPVAQQLVARDVDLVADDGLDALQRSCMVMCCQAV